MKNQTQHDPHAARRTRRAPAILAAASLALSTAFTAMATRDVFAAPMSERVDEDRCEATAAVLFRACRLEIRDDAAKALANCINISDSTERAGCLTEAKAARAEHEQLCVGQRDARRAACKALNEDRYDPDFSPGLFDDPKNPSNPNPYFPLKVGSKWEYRDNTTEHVNFEVTPRTKSIEGVTCIAIVDRVTQDGLLHEDTEDWFAAAKDGSVWYFGEEVKNYESFDNDKPKTPELVSIDGSFKVGRDRAKPGIIFQGSPRPGQIYREEFSLGNAEDLAEVLTTTYSFGKDAELDKFVPPALARLFCSDDCVVTRNTNLTEPGAVTLKYYGRGIGSILEVKPDTGVASRLVGCNFDSRCSQLGKP